MPQQGQRVNAQGVNDRNGEYVLDRSGQPYYVGPAPAQGGGGGGPDVAVTSADTGPLETRDDGGVVRLGSDSAPGDEAQSRLDNIENIFEGLDEDNRKLLEDFLGTSLPELEAAADAANRGDKRALAQFLKQTDKLTEIDPHVFDGPISSSAEDIGHQEAARDKFKELSDPSITASERYILESARLDEEQGRRAAMEAQLSQLSARGARSGGADITAMLGAQQQTSQNRAIQDLGALAQAQERAQRNLEGYAGQSNTMRSANDEILRFNAMQKESYEQFADGMRERQQNDAHNRNRDRFDATTNVNDSTYDRNVDKFDAQGGAWEARSGLNRETAGNRSNTEMLRLGIDEERRAESLYPEDEKPGFWENATNFLADPADLLGGKASPINQYRKIAR